MIAKPNDEEEEEEDREVISILELGVSVPLAEQANWC
jgi:hypothetical protein